MKVIGTNNKVVGSKQGYYKERAGIENTGNKKPRCLWHSSNGHVTSECRIFLAADNEEKAKLIKENQACWSCLKSGHKIKDCWNRKVCEVEGCDKTHHPSLHAIPVNGLGLHTSLYGSRLGSNNLTEGCLLQIMTIYCKDGELKVLWDCGANISLITFKAAHALRLKGRKVQLAVNKVGGGTESVASSLYTLPLFDREKNIVKVNVFVIEKISSAIQIVDEKKIVKRFEGAEENEFKMSNGEIGVLIGFNYAPLHPVMEKSVGDLFLMKNRFGRCVAGTVNQVSQINPAVHNVIRYNDAVERFLDVEEMGVRCIPECGGCKCGKCQVGGKNYSIKEEREKKLIVEGLVLADGHFLVKYPWIKNPKELPDNKFIVQKMLKTTEKRIMKNTYHAKVYNEQIQDMLDRKVARKLTKEELRNYNGPSYYLSHHEVWRLDSSTTCRIVFNSSLKFCGQTLNDYWAKGPNLLNDLLGVLLRFREGKVVLTGDIRKMYHAIKLSLLDQHTHRFFWRFLETYREPDTYVMTSVSFRRRISPLVPNVFSEIIPTQHC